MRTRPLSLLSGPTRKITSLLGPSAVGAQITKRSQLSWPARNDVVQAVAGQPPQRPQKHWAEYRTGKQRSRRNAVRHGLTAETVIGVLEDAEDYKAFEEAISADYDAQSAVECERELVLRLASVLWRLRRATAMETGLFEVQAKHLSAFRESRTLQPASREVVYALFRPGNPGSHCHSPCNFQI
jgi:hypothetical protein